ncbi:MAG TPA: invasion associated locus B family protein [Paenirhodobacter sp.]
MTDFKKSVAAALVLCMIAPVSFAQDAAAPATEAPATDAPATQAPDADATTPDATAVPPAASAEGPGTSYIADTYGDWKMQCFRSEDGNDPCQMYQLLHDEKGNPVADISMIALPAGNKAVAGATIMTPLETLLTANLALKVDNQPPKGYPFTFCAQPGCFSRIGLLPEELAQLKKGNKISMTIVPVATPNQPVNVDISLKGFTTAYDAVAKHNADMKPKQ